MKRLVFGSVWVLAALWTGCGVRTSLGVPNRGEPADGGRFDAGQLDAGRFDAGRFDAGHEASIGLDVGPPPLDIGLRDVGPRPPDTGRPLPQDGGVECQFSWECDDGLYCNGSAYCSAGRCIPLPTFCDDGIDCTEDTCFEPGGCSNNPRSDRCPMGLVCQIGRGCVPSTGCADGRPCDDGLFCNGFEYCLDGFCQSLMNNLCDDLVPCTIDLCREPGSCEHIPDSSQCPPGWSCQAFAGCAPPDCSLCNDGLVCNGEETCGPDGQCFSGFPLSCFDGLDCTDDVCREPFGCSFEQRSPRELCTNGIDDDCDLEVDCADLDCFRNPRCIRRDAGPSPFFDAGSPFFDAGPQVDFPEQSIGACTNFFDDDFDGRVDCDDSSCRPIPNGECCNGADDDGDGVIDGLACYCESDADCAGIGNLISRCWRQTFRLCGPDCRRYGGDAFCRRYFADFLTRCDQGTGECAP